MKHLALVMLALAGTACVPAVPVVVIDTTPAAARAPKPATEIVDVAAVTPRDGTGVIVVTRPKSLLRTGCTYDVTLDDQLVAALRSGEQVTLYADPGQRVVGISTRDAASCDPASASVPLEVVAHATKTIELGSDLRYDLKVEVNTHGGSLPP
jgi:hypothetical protein